jgi:transcriptional regulator GlxA family with amidase domain
MSFAELTRFASQNPVRILLINAGAADDLAWVNLLQPLRKTQRMAGARCQLRSVSWSEVTPKELPFPFDVVLLVADEDVPCPAYPALSLIQTRLAGVPFWGAVGAPVLWLADSGVLAGVRIALPWSLYGEVDTQAERAIISPQLYEFDQNKLTCCGATASLDFALTLVGALFGASMQGQIADALCVERVRAGNERQRAALSARASLPPKLAEALELMQANIEEPLSTDDIAQLVSLSRRQLERLFKQHLDNLPSRYYLELRLQRARQLLQETHQSIVQIGLMCGFSSGSHFSTAFGVLFGITPREERQRRMGAALGSPVGVNAVEK